jgi:hypothetical protein
MFLPGKAVEFGTKASRLTGFGMAFIDILKEFLDRRQAHRKAAV